MGMSYLEKIIKIIDVFKLKLYRCIKIKIAYWKNYFYNSNLIWRLDKNGLYRAPINFKQYNLTNGNVPTLIITGNYWC